MVKVGTLFWASHVWCCLFAYYGCKFINHLMQDLAAAVEKMNSSLTTKGKSKGDNFFHQDEIASLGLGT